MLEVKSQSREPFGSNPSLESIPACVQNTFYDLTLFDDVEVKQFGHQIFTMIRFTSTRLESRDRVIYDFINYSFGYLE